MTKLNKEFFSNNEVLFVGFSEKNSKYCMTIYQAYTNNGIQVYPLNTKAGGSYDVKVYKNFSELPKIPETAYILLSPENTKKAVKALAENGVKKILFHNKKIADADTLAECDKMGIKTAVACPLMIFGSGLHKIHGFFAGVR
ncbi:MAG: CoA-binding protein [Clostridia bacterium]|nr:CoA-binding protein [Clostridia bacterium]